MKNLKLFNTKIRIEKLEKKLSNTNCWLSNYIFWKEVWASISIKDISSKRVLYLFTIRWHQEKFPLEFRIKINDTIFVPTQPPISDPAAGNIIFHAIIKTI